MYYETCEKHFSFAYADNRACKQHIHISHLLTVEHRYNIDNQFIVNCP